jgi:dipeptidyl aminopeptidase/acylaminoacyl peptidase
MRNKSRGLAILFGLIAANAPAQWTPELSMRVKTVGDVQPSPDGKLVVYTQRTAVIDTEKSEYVTHVFLAQADGSRSIQLTRGDKSSTAPVFSPDGRYVYFRSERTGKPNLFRISIDGGEAEKLTDWKGTIGVFQLSPDGKWIAFAGTEADTDEEPAKREKRDFRVIDELPKNHALWLVSSGGSPPPRRVFTAQYHVAVFDWSPDSKCIAFEHRPTPDFDVVRRADISEAVLETGVVTAVAATPAQEADPKYSRDGRYLAYSRRSDGGRLTGSRIVLLTRAGGAVRELPPTADESPVLVDWTADSGRLLYTENKRTRSALYAVPPDGPHVVLYDSPKGVASSLRLNTSGTHAGFVQQSPDDPPEAYVMDVAKAAPVRVSRANVDLARQPLGETRVIRWKGQDGLEIEGLLTLPVGYESGKKYPLILNVHGGPAGVFGETFTASPGIYPIATFAAKGYAVLRPNPRGSSAYGQKFRGANLNDWGGGDYNDLMSGVDHVIGMGIADPARMAVMGWSYGGYMTAWVVTQTSRFKAAAMGAGLSNIISMWGTNDIPSILDDYFSGTPWEQPERYRKLSPLFHVKNATTPTLILHGEADLRVPTSQGYEFHNALTRRGVETKMVVYPRTPHGPQEPKFLLDIMNRHIDWVEQHLK